MATIDLNADLGESFGAWTMGHDEALLRYVSAVNLACGFHAGDPHTLRKGIVQALAHNVAIGAHPSYPDLLGFGRRDMALTPDEVFDCVLYQVAAVKGMCEALGGRLHHVKPHGALYNRAARDAAVAAAIADAVRRIDDRLVLYGLAGSCLMTEGTAAGLRTAGEAFADRRYGPDGTLVPRSQPDALITTTDEAVAQVRRIVHQQQVVAGDGSLVSVRATTLCLHGDGPQALAFAQAIRQALEADGVSIAPPYAAAP
ncbi:MAG: 5-oxoprolinase subunit PxpA [Chloracidobacterium sp.]|uniref:5-oxoprolinase subunit A n=1 Tax=Chloracidobacterium validum TaxID=2821543 RepID=A0ABX8B9E5_9BACT|nr:5-oxoprolinase subunit PxpA [Chloracidobacterium validum]QUW02290.1 LamB/YcsF family protein [Chloracidobacterium validum]